MKKIMHTFLLTTVLSSGMAFAAAGGAGGDAPESIESLRSKLRELDMRKANLVARAADFDTIVKDVEKDVASGASLLVSPEVLRTQVNSKARAKKRGFEEDARRVGDEIHQVQTLIASHEARSTAEAKHAGAVSLQAQYRLQMGDLEKRLEALHSEHARALEERDARIAEHNTELVAAQGLLSGLRAEQAAAATEKERLVAESTAASARLVAAQTAHEAALVDARAKFEEEKVTALATVVAESAAKSAAEQAAALVAKEAEFEAKKNELDAAWRAKRAAALEVASKERSALEAALTASGERNADLQAKIIGLTAQVAGLETETGLLRDEKTRFIDDMTTKTAEIKKALDTTTTLASAGDGAAVTGGGAGGSTSSVLPARTPAASAPASGVSSAAAAAATVTSGAAAPRRQVNLTGKK